jgi:hypothetical protein
MHCPSLGTPNKIDLTPIWLGLTNLKEPFPDLYFDPRRIFLWWKKNRVDKRMVSFYKSLRPSWMKNVEDGNS